MLKAGELLRQGKDNVEEIAVRIGFESGAAFSQAFKREIGLAPGTTAEQPFRRSHNMILVHRVGGSKSATHPHSVRPI